MHCLVESVLPRTKTPRSRRNLLFKEAVDSTCDTTHPIHNFLVYVVFVHSLRFLRLCESRLFLRPILGF